MTLRRKDDLLIVSIIPKSGELEDNAKDRLSPLVVSGTPDELDEGFIGAIETPVKQATGLLSNMTDFERSAKEAEANSKAAKAKADAEKKKAEAKKKKFDKLVEKADALEKEKDYRGTVKALTEALELFPDDKKSKSRIDDLKSKLSQNSLFAGTEEEE